MLLERFRLDGKVAVVTGSGRGIGRGAALALAEAGACVVVAARTQDQIEAVAREIEAFGVKGLAVKCDVSSPDEIDELVEKTIGAFGRIDVLVNNAGGSLPGLALYIDHKDLEEAFHFNVSSAFMLCRRVIPRMLEKDGGAIVNISSALSHYVESGFLAYGTSKAALSHMSRLLACEFAPRIRVNALAVGSVRTDALSFVLTDSDIEEKMISLTPMGRLGTVEDVALAVLYLASPASSWVTGKIFEIDGGSVASTWPMKFSAF